MRTTGEAFLVSPFLYWRESHDHGKTEDADVVCL